MGETGEDRVVAGRYVLQRLLGTGGMGRVWLATDGVLDRDVAVEEVTFPAVMTDAERRRLRERTLREARAAARLERPWWRFKGRSVVVPVAVTVLLLAAVLTAVVLALGAPLGG